MLGGMRRRSVSIVACLALVLGACAAPPPEDVPSDVAASADPVSTASAASSPTSEPSETATATPEPEPEPEPLAWARLDVAGPAAREDHTWTLDAAGEVAYLFGGRDGATTFDDTWAFNLRDENWTRLTPAAAPPGRFGHEAVWVDALGLVVFAGQADPDSFFNDLWTYDPSTNVWSELPAQGALPTPRYGSCAAIGPDGRLWISHGFTQDQVRFSDTAAYDFETDTWTDETPSDGARPVERCLHGCWWTEDGDLALYAGQTTGVTALDDRWIMRDGAWSPVEGALPPARNLYARARHATGTIVLGGQALDGGYLADLWLLEDGTTESVSLEPAGEPPPGRAGAELIVDADGGRGLMFGGRTDDGTLDDLWILTGL